MPNTQTTTCDNREFLSAPSDQVRTETLLHRSIGESIHSAPTSLTRDSVFLISNLLEHLSLPRQRVSVRAEVT